MIGDKYLTWEAQEDVGMTIVNPGQVVVVEGSSELLEALVVYFEALDKNEREE
jgi:hypothetical protein